MKRSDANRVPASRSKEKSRTALSFDMKQDRTPAIELEGIRDVQVLTCAELSLQLLKRPEINTNSFFSAVVASRSDVNISDSVIVITAAILETLGNTKAAASVLKKSSTVFNLYNSMRLNEESIRGPFVVLMFAVCPGFIKMLESTVTTIMNRVKNQTDAPHSGGQLLEATGLLARRGTISTDEHSNMMLDLSESISKRDSQNSWDSLQKTPPDLVASEIRAGLADIGSFPEDRSKLSTSDLMRHIKSNDRHKRWKMSSDIDPLKPVVRVDSVVGRSGIGFKSAASAITSAESETNFSSVINSLFPAGLRSTRQALSKDRMDVRKKIFKDRNEVAPASTIYESANSIVNSLPEDKYENVTMEDVTAKLKESNIVVESPSIIHTTSGFDMTDEEFQKLID